MSLIKSFRIGLTIFAALISAAMTSAQEPVRDDALTLEMRAGHSAVYEYFTAASLKTLQTFDDNFFLEAGIRYSSIGKTALEARPAYHMEMPWGMLSAEAILEYTNLNSVNNFAAGAGVGISGTWIGGRLGYYYRLYGGKGGKIHEPFNIYYELCANFLPMIRYWDLQFAITNCEMFELERHYQPTFMIECFHYPMDALGVSLALGCKPAGIFNMSVGYYQTFINLGVCYRW